MSEKRKNAGNKEKQNGKISVQALTRKRASWMGIFLLLLYYLCLSLGSFYSFVDSFQLEHGRIAVGAGGGFFCVFFYLALNWKKGRKAFFIVLLPFLALMVFLFRALLMEALVEMGEVLSNYFYDYFSGGYETVAVSIVNPAAMTVFLLFALFLLTLGIGVGLFWMRSKAMVCLLTFPLLAAPMLLGGFPGEGAFFSYLMGCLGMMAFLSNKKVFDSNSHALENYRFGIQAKAGMILGILGLLLLGVVSIWSGPRLERTEELRMSYKDQIRNADYEEIWDSIPILSNYEYLFGWGDMATGGVTNGDLSGARGFFQSSRKALEVTVESRPAKTLYLKGYIGARYTPERWEEMNEEFEDFLEDQEYYGLDRSYVLAEVQSLNYYYLELGRLRVRNLFTEVNQDDYQTETISINRLRANSAYRYLPYNALITDSGLIAGDAYIEGDGVDAYRYTYYPDKNVEELRDYMIYAQDYDYVSTSVYDEYVYEHYLELPEGMERLKEQCAAVQTEDLNSMISYVRTSLGGLTYNQNVGLLPEGEELVEYFLYEKQEGYCVHFATTATLMFRMLGVPARYVSGYAAMPGSFVHDRSAGTYTAEVTSDRAHAWTEIYVEEQGWIPIETTPGYVSSAAVSPVERTANQTGDEEEPQSESRQEQSESRSSQQSDSAQDQSEAQGKTRTRDKLLSWGWLLYLLAGTGLVILALGVMQLQRKIRFRHKLGGIGKLPVEKRISHMFYCLYELAVYDGLDAQLECLTEAFVHQLSSKYKCLEEEDISVLLQIVYAANYGNEALTAEQWKFVRDIYRSLVKEIYQNSGTYQRFIMKYIKTFC